MVRKLLELLTSLIETKIFNVQGSPVYWDIACPVMGAPE